MTDFTSKLKPKYDGSVKRVYTSPAASEQLFFEFSDDFSVFDWGKMPDKIENKGRALTILGAYFFERLAQAAIWKELPKSKHLGSINKNWLANVFESETFQDYLKHGCPSHYCGLVGDGGESLSLAEAGSVKKRVFMQVEEAHVYRPQPAFAFEQNLFYYPPLEKRQGSRLIPLEVVFRFGMPAGSSLKNRLEKDPSYASVLGLGQADATKEGAFFERPVLELYTKLEPKDRLLSVQEAFLLSQLEPENFEALSDSAYCLALALFHLFAERGIELWDGKFEFILKDGRLKLADSIGPDELRLMYGGCHLSKEMIRQVYRGGSWELALKEAQRIAFERKTLDWKGICQKELGQEPPPLQPNFRMVANMLYGSLANAIIGQEIFPSQLSLDDFANSAQSVGFSKVPVA